MEAKGQTREQRLYSNLPLLCGKKQREMKEMAGSYQSRYENILTVFSPIISNAKAAQDHVQTRRTRGSHSLKTDQTIASPVVKMT